MTPNEYRKKHRRCRSLRMWRMMKYIASCSFGKDSLAMVLLLIEMGYPLDEVIFFNTGMEFEAIYSESPLRQTNKAKIWRSCYEKEIGIS